MKQGNNGQVEDFAKLFKSLKDSERYRYFKDWYNNLLAKDEFTESLYFYNGKKWEKLKTDGLNKIIISFLEYYGVEYGMHNVKSLSDLIIAKTEILNKPNPDYISFSNGVIHRNTGKFLPHSPDYFLRSNLNVFYSFEKKETPNFDKWINWAAQNNPEKKKRILAAFYMILTNSYQWQLFLEITGEGGSGKSIFNEIAIMLVGEDNATSINFKDLEKISSRTKLLDKMLIFAPDQGNIVSDGSILKALTGGDMMSFEPKYKDPFDARIQSIFLMTNNKPAIFTEHAGGIARRRVLFHFAEKVPDEMKDEHLKEKIAEELPQIIHLLIDTFKNNPQEAKFLLEAQKDSKEAIKIKMKMDHLMHFASFFETRAQINGLKRGDVKDYAKAHTALYSAYREYCTFHNEKHPIKNRNFLDEFSQALKEHKNRYPLQLKKTAGEYKTNVYFKRDYLEILHKWED